MHAWCAMCCPKHLTVSLHCPIFEGVSGTRSGLKHQTEVTEAPASSFRTRRRLPITVQAAWAPGHCRETKGQPRRSKETWLHRREPCRNPVTSVRAKVRKHARTHQETGGLVFVFADLIEVCSGCLTSVLYNIMKFMNFCRGERKHST